MCIRDSDLPVLPGVTLSLFADDAMYHYSSVSVSYTHLDVYKRQVHGFCTTVAYTWCVRIKKGTLPG